MSNVVAFPDRGAGPHIQGPVRCVGCRHEWTAVTEPGVFDVMECPACGAYKGIRLGLIEPPDLTHWVCNCSCPFFSLPTSGAPICINCGQRATSWADG